MQKENNRNRIKQRIKERLFHLRGIEEVTLHRDPAVALSPDTPKMAIKEGIKRILRGIPVIGPVIIWLWRILNLPRWFHTLSRHFEGVVDQIDILTQRQTELDNEIKQLHNTLHIIKTVQEEHEKTLNQLYNTSFTKASHIEESIVIEPERLTLLERSPSTSKDDFYFAFENTFRGRESEIEGQQRLYLPFILDTFKSAKEGRYFLDAGCGRGEFMRILKDANIPVRGVTINEAEYDYLKGLGLDVELTDINAFLEGLHDNTLIGLSCFQLVEHLQERYLKRLIELSYKKIGLNGIIIIETINPKCGYALNNFFYLDPSHIRPYPPELLQFMLEWYGFKDLKIVYSSPCPERFRIRNTPECNYMDYALIGWKR